MQSTKEYKTRDLMGFSSEQLLMEVVRRIDVFVACQDNLTQATNKLNDGGYTSPLGNDMHSFQLKRWQDAGYKPLYLALLKVAQVVDKLNRNPKK